MPLVHLVCRCGAEFTRPEWRVRQATEKGAAMHCSYACAHAARRTRTPESKAEYHRLYREKNREIINQKQNAALHGEKREHILAQRRASYWRNLEISRQRARDYAAEHREEATARRKAWPAQNPERNAFHIERSNIAHRTGMLPSEIPDELVEAKIEQLKIARWVREQLALAGEAGTAETPKRDSVHEHATAKPERPNATPILPKKERTHE